MVDFHLYRHFVGGWSGSGIIISSQKMLVSKLVPEWEGAMQTLGEPKYRIRLLVE
jgi:hypothetical protein